MGLFTRKPQKPSPPERPLNDVTDLLSEFEVGSVPDLAVALEGLVGVEDDLFLEEISDGSLLMRLGNDAHAIAFPTTRSELINEIVAADEDALGFESTRGRQDWDLMDGFND